MTNSKPIGISLLGCGTVGGGVIRLQELNEGLRVTVLDLSLAEELNLEALREERAALAPGSLIRR